MVSLNVLIRLVVRCCNDVYFTFLTNIIQLLHIEIRVLPGALTRAITWASGGNEEN